jgi:hypothetical protein
MNNPRQFSQDTVMLDTVKRARLLALATLSSAMLVACGGDSNTTSAVDPQRPAGSAAAGVPSNGSAAAAGSVTLTWYPPTHNVDGTPLNNLRGYRIYWGTTEGNYPNTVTIDNAGLASYVVEQLAPARWFFVVTAISAGGAESGFSNVFSRTVR